MGPALPSRITMTNEALPCRDHRYGEQIQTDFQENWELKKHAQSIVVLERACAASWICFYRHIKVIAHEAISSRSSEILGYERLPVSGTGHGMMSVQTLTLHDRFP